ncbi:hypothetical protein BDW74DRAFT_170028 [Aspergillus multicolor]|uniref:uncharacterized protein n=1 Tax=Aspergillus multicolor TaxID=41759 RepID=UPI003CCD50C1
MASPSTQVSSLARLPNELILMVTEYLPRQKDLSAFMRCNKRLYHLLHPALCRLNVQEHNSTALLFAAENNYTTLAKALIKSGASAAAIHPTGFRRYSGNYLSFSPNPLIEAAQHGHISTLAVLLSEPEPPLAYRWILEVKLRALLHWALNTGDTDLDSLDMVLAKRPPLGLPRSADERYNGSIMKNTALGLAIVRGCSTAIIERLLRAGADIDERESPHPWLEATVQRGGEMRELMVSYGLRPKSDRILCEIAQRFDDPDMLGLFTDPKQGGLDVAVYGHTALFTAVDQGHFKVVKYLAQQGANANLKFYYGDRRWPYSTAWPAIRNRRMDILRYLVDEADMDPSVEDVVMAVGMDSDEAEHYLLGYECADVVKKVDIPTYVAIMEQEEGHSVQFTIRI